MDTMLNFLNETLKNLLQTLKERLFPTPQAKKVPVRKNTRNNSLPPHLR